MNAERRTSFWRSFLPHAASAVIGLAVMLVAGTWISSWVPVVDSVAGKALLAGLTTYVVYRFLSRSKDA